MHIEAVPGANQAARDLKPLVEAGRALNDGRQIDRDAVFQLKMRALEDLWARFGSDPTFDSYCITEGKALREFAVFCVPLSTTAGTGTLGPATIGALTLQRWPNSQLHMPTACGSTSGCSGCLMNNWPKLQRSLPSCKIYR